MKKLTERIEHIGERVTERNQKLPRALAKKMESIRRGEDETLPAYLAETQHTDAGLYFTPHTESSQGEAWLPSSKKSHAPTPNVILRSALFGVMKKGSRKYERNSLKATFNGYTVKYTGEQLDQSDLDVWLECLERCQTSPLGNTIRFTSHNFLRSLGRDTGKSQHEWLKICLLRLTANAAEISDGKYTYIGSLIDSIYREENTGWTGINKSVRLQLKGKPLTLWLHGFYSSHSNPVPMKVSTIKSLCGSERGELYKFRFDLKKALIELSLVTGWGCFIDDIDLVNIKK